MTQAWLLTAHSGNTTPHVTQHTAVLLSSLCWPVGVLLIINYFNGKGLYRLSGPVNFKILISLVKLFYNTKSDVGFWLQNGVDEAGDAGLEAHWAFLLPCCLPTAQSAEVRGPFHR